jgi:acetyltransferase-like isoleucine patch superfamily enzyme
MVNSDYGLFQVLEPGKPIEGDWCNFQIPLNMQIGENTVIDSSACFKKFFSKLPVGFKTGINVTLQGPQLAPEENGYIEIGDYSYVSSACITCYSKIVVGQYVFISPGVTIVDTDFHPLDAGQRMLDTIAISTVGNKSLRPKFEIAPVYIEDDVWIGYNATILKGVTIGRGAIIEPGAVVSKDVPPGAIAFGNPAQIKLPENA